MAVTTDADTAIAERFELVDVDLIHESPDNPRTDPGNLDDLIASIRANGVLEPIILTEGIPDGADVRLGGEDRTNFTLVAGERRLAASRQAGLPAIPAVIRAAAPVADVLVLMLIENIQREDLDPFDEGAAYVRLIEEFGLKNKDICTRVGRSSGHVSKRVALVKLPSTIRSAVGAATNGITLHEAYRLTELVDEPDRLKAAFEQRRYGHGSVEREVTRQVTERDREKKRSKLVTSLAKAGTRLLDEPDFQNNEGVDSLGIDAAAHATEPCAAVWINHLVEPVAMCTDPARHEPDGASELKADLTDDDDDQARHEADLADDDRDAAEPGHQLTDEAKARFAAEAEERAAARAAQEEAAQHRAELLDSRAERLHDIVTAAKFSKPAVVDLLSSQMVALADDDDGRIWVDVSAACAWLGLEVDDSKDWDHFEYPNNAFVRWAVKGGLQAIRAAVAYALSIGEHLVTSGHKRDVTTVERLAIDAHHAFLGLHGFVFDELDEAAKAWSIDDTRAEAITGTPAPADKADGEAPTTEEGQGDLDTETLLELQARFELTCSVSKVNDNARALSEEAREAFADALAATHPDPVLAAAELQALVVGHRKELDDNGPIDTRKNGDGDLDRFNAFGLGLLEILDAGRPVPIGEPLRTDVADRDAVSFNTREDWGKSKKLFGRLRVEDLLDAYNRRTGSLDDDDGGTDDVQDDELVTAGATATEAAE